MSRHLSPVPEGSKTFVRPFNRKGMHELLPHCQIYKNTVQTTSSVASGGGGSAGTPPPEIGKIVVEIWCYLPEVYTFGAESEIQEIFSKIL